jgi:methionyl-tRNA formyltransferase
MRIAVAASPAVAISSLEALLSSKHQLIRVISQPDRPAGRGRALVATPVSQWAIANEIELVCPNTPSEIRSLIEDIDCVVTIGYGHLIPGELLNLPRFGFINVHFSILPRWRGAAPVQRAIEAGDSFSGVTVFKLDEGMDTGPFYLMSRFALDSDITSDELLHELGELAPESLLESLDLIESGVKPTPQIEQGATRAFKLSKEEAKVDWHQECERVSAHIRAFTSIPGAWTLFRGEPMKLTFDSFSDQQIPPGEMRNLNGNLIIGTTTSAIVVSTVTPSGKSSQLCSAWLNGARLREGEMCE